MKIVSIRLQNGAEIVGKLDMEHIPIKTLEGWGVPTPTAEEPDAGRGIASFVLQQPVELFRVPTAGPQGRPVIMPLMTGILNTADPQEEIVIYVSDIFQMFEAHAEFQNVYTKMTSGIDLSAAQAPGIVVPGR